MITAKHVAEILRVAHDSVRKLIRDGHLKAYRVGGVLRVHPEDLKAYLDRSVVVKTGITGGVAE